MSAWYSFKGGKKLSELAEAEFAQSQQDLIYRTTDAYLDILRAQTNLESSIAEEAAVKQQLDQTQQRFDVGLVAITDVHESQAVYDITKVSRLVNEGSLETAYELLSILTNQRHSNIDALTDQLPITQPEPLQKDEWVAIAMTNNLSIKIAQLSSNAAQYNAKATKSNHYPVVSAAASYSDFHREGDQFNIADVTSDSEQTTIGLSVKLPLYSGGAISAQRRKAYADLDQTKDILALTTRTTKQLIRSYHIALLTSIQQVAARKQAIISNESALEAIQAGYSVGTRTVVDVLNAQRGLYAAQRDYANSRYDYILSLLKLKQAAGTLNPGDIENLNKWIVSAQNTSTETIIEKDS